MLSSQIQLSVFILFLSFKNSVLIGENTAPISKDTSQRSSHAMDMKKLIEFLFNITMPTHEHYQPKNVTNPLHRVKRQQQQGESKYTTASKMPETKIIRLLAQMLANPFSTVYIGGGHPFHPEVPKSIVILFRQKIMDFLFPRIGDRF